MTFSDQGATVVNQPVPAPPLVGRFPTGFVWGTATAAYQIEGGADADGRGLSIWDTFSRTPGTIRNGDTGDVAADHYHRYAEDVALMADIGVQAYRFSVSWPRIQPDGRGPVNQAGLDFYRRLTDALLEAGVTPVLTLYHWDLPQALEDKGGWPLRETAERFADYAALVYEALGDRVPVWTTMNEPWCAAFLGYCAGRHAPGRREPEASLRAAHHLLLAHGLAIRAMRAAGERGNQFSITLNLDPVLPASTSAGDLDAVRRIDALYNRLFLDTVLLGRYPDDLLRDMRRVTDWSFVSPGDGAIMAAPIDMLGVNYYRPFRVTSILGPAEGPADGATAVRSVGEADGLATTFWRTPGPSPYPGSEDIATLVPPGPLTASGWEIYPQGLRDLLLRIHREYPPIPLAITENGAAFDDVVEPDGRIRDHARIAFLARHFAAAQDAIATGVDLRGYFVWSLLDNFEWAEGYARRFGLIHVDFDTGERRLKDSALWYRDVIARNGIGPIEDGNA